ncbi:MAG: alpha-2-macroglobulin [Proteobacteria bacterium]|nr:alpha-2-macroglobulin [Pseudomonadota bacterium]
MSKFIAAGLLVLLAATDGHAAQIAGVTPQGEVAQVLQVTVRFSEAVVPFGDLKQPDPMSIACEGGAPAGSGRWANDRTWLYDFRAALGPGVRCSVSLRAGWKPLAGELGGKTSFRFGTGGPAIVAIEPYARTEIAEDQYFLATLSGAVVPASVADHAWCEAEGIGEKIPVRIVEGDARAQLLKTHRLDAAQAARTLVLACQRPLPGGAAMRFVWGQGIAVAANAAVVTTIEQRYDYKVRAPFTAEFTCERERASAPCLPIRPMSLRFSAPVARERAAQIRLRPDAGSAAAKGEPIAPRFDKDDRNNEVDQVNFPIPLAENTRYRIELPANFADNAGRPLSNASTFPLAVATGDAPPIAKFAAAPFGVVELHADAMLPLTLRHVQGDLRPAATTGQVRVKRIDGDRDILAWYAKLKRWDEATLTAQELGLPQKDWTTTEQSTDARGRTVTQRVDRTIATREVPMLGGDAGAKRMALPQLEGGDPRPFEVVGIPLPEPGYQVVEIESQRLGASLLAKPAPMYVRTGVLVTNLGVHFKLGRESSLVWVTTLDFGKPVEGADVVVNDCRGAPLWSGRTDATGLARVPKALDASMEDCPADDGYFVSARKRGDQGIDTAFVFSSWQKGIEAWRYNQPMGRGAPDVRAHTVFDRTLLRAGETVSMKHFIRTETSTGLANLAAADLPNRLEIVHVGSGQKTSQPLAWHGARDAVSSWNIPPAAKLGVYTVTLVHDDADPTRRHAWQSGDFRVEEFRLPLVDARVIAPKAPVVAPATLALGVQLDYLSGGPMANAPARASALLKPRSPSFAGYDDYSFDPPRDPNRRSAGDGSDSEEPENDGKLVADKLPLTTDRNGAAQVELKELPKIARPSAVTAEVTFNDPNGEVQTASTQIDLWPSAVVLGVKAGSWASARGKARFTVIALDTTGKPLTGQKVDVRGRVSQVITTRKRLVGGFYAYDNRTEVKDLGSLCSGSTDSRGLLLCEADLQTAGQVELIASATDADRHPVEAAASVWVTKQGELWFAQDNDDRIDVLPEKKHYEPGETARLQVRMPFREATALVSVEREGIVDARVMTLRGDDPTVELKIDKRWGPNVYVSVLALRGRIRDVPWYSFFTWGWKEPLSWVRAFWYEGREYQAPTAMVDLSKPAFKLGVAALKVGIADYTLQVGVTPDQPQYQVRGKARAKVKVAFDGKPLAGTQVAFAAVDEALLALRPNASWDLLGAMLQPRPWGVETSTAQSEIIGRRHYGRKAVAAGGGGGHSNTRELFDTLLVWQPEVVLDANGEATIEVPINDSLTSFRLVAIADAAGSSGLQRFGTGSASIKVTQDLQALPGLPPLVRTGDRYDAMVTLRNTTAREMKVHATLQGTAADAGGGNDIRRTPITAAAQDVTVAAGGAQVVSWPIAVPDDATSIAWELAADEQGSGGAKDRVRLTQLVAPAVPIEVQQATLEQLDGRYTLPVAAPAAALPASGVKLGGVRIALQPKLTGALPGMRRYFETYPFICLEQKTSKSVGLKDAKLWTAVANSLPTYLDHDGLAAYFPPRAEDPASGSDRLTAYVLAATHEAGFELPPDARDAMLDGLTAFVEGRIERKFWSPKNDLDVRKLAAIDALARYGRAQPKMLGSVNLTPNVWPTAAVIDWLDILKRVDGLPDRALRFDEANQILRSRLTYAGTTLKFSTEDGDFWWWLMDSADANAARLILAVLDDPAWKSDLPRMVVGSLGRQRGGHWLTTTANLWGSLALDKFAAKFESEKLAGKTSAGYGDALKAVADWPRQPDGAAATLPWPTEPATLNVAQEGSGKPWLTVQSLAAVPLKEPVRAGYAITRSVSAVEQKDPQSSTTGIWSRGDVLKIHLEVEAQSDMTWVVVSDPVPAGATILGSGLGRDSAIATRTERSAGNAWPAFEERSFEAFRSYYGYLPRGKQVIEYSVRLNNPGRFNLPPTRVEAMYAPESFGALPNAALEVRP